MTPHRGNTTLFRSSQQLPRFHLGPLVLQRYQDTIGFTPSKTNDANLVYWFATQTPDCKKKPTEQN